MWEGRNSSGRNTTNDALDLRNIPANKEKRIATWVEISVAAPRRHKTFKQYECDPDNRLRFELLWCSTILLQCVSVIGVISRWSWFLTSILFNRQLRGFVASTFGRRLKSVKVPFHSISSIQRWSVVKVTTVFVFGIIGGSNIIYVFSLVSRFLSQFSRLIQ